MSGLDDERRWQAMGNLICEAEKFYLQHDGKAEWDALMEETNRILDLDDATLLDNLSERRACPNCGATERPDACSGGPTCAYPPPSHGGVSANPPPTDCTSKGKP